MSAVPNVSATAVTVEAASPKTPGSTRLPTAKHDRNLELAWRNITFRVEVDNKEYESDPVNQPKKVMKTLLDNMNGTVRGGRVLAIMGPSGAGKTLLMNSFMGRLDGKKPNVFEGGCYVNGLRLSGEYRRLFSMVAQDDIVMGKETPWDALYFSARIRLGVDHEEAAYLATQALEQLHITDCKDTIIGVPGHIKGISGGEKKRVNIGNELITNPYIMILDEPTSGLDSVNAMRVGHLLNELAHDEGRTVVCTIHTPSSELFHMFDDLLLLAKGHVIYLGPRDEALAYFEGAGYPAPPRVNPSEFYMDLLQKKEDEGLRDLWEHWEKYSTSDAAKNNKSLAPLAMPTKAESERLISRCQGFGSTTTTQYLLLTRRALRMWSREPFVTFGRLAENIFVGFLVGLFFFNIDDTSSGVSDVAGLLFGVMTAVMFGSGMPGVVSFEPERPIFLTEQSSEMYHPTLYILAKFTAELPSQIAFNGMFGIVVYWLTGLHASASAFFIFFLILQILGYVGYAFGLLCSAIFKTAENALVFAPLILMPLMIVGGLLANTDRLEPQWIWLNYLSFPRYGYSALLVNQLRAVETLCPSSPDLGVGCIYRTSEEYLKIVGFNNWEWWYSVIGLLVLIVLMLALASGLLTRLGYSRRQAMSYNYACVIENDHHDEVTNANAGTNRLPEEGQEQEQEMAAVPAV